MTTRNVQWLAAMVLICCFCGLDVNAALKGNEAKPVKDLYYFVIDRSYSIGEKKLVDPFRKAVVDFVGKLDPETQVDIVFFSDSATSPRSWCPMDLRAKGEFGKYFDDNFKPGGQTLLYATVADVLSRVLAIEKDFRNINIVILSDGEDNKSKPKFTKWEDVEQLLPEKWAKQRKGLSVIWAAVEFDPPQKDKPASDSIVQMLPKLDRTEIERVFSPPPRAAFAANPTKVKVGESVLFALYDDTGVSTVKWTFGDGAESSKKTESHRYAAKGNYDISVEATGPGGKARAALKGYVQVVEEVPLEGRFSWHPSLIRVGDDVKFTDESLGVPTTWEWEFEGLGTNKDRNPTIVFTKPGKTKVSLAVAKEGASHLFLQELEVLPLPPDANFTAEPSEVEMGQVVHLKASKHENGWTHTWVIGSDVTEQGAEVSWTANKLGRVGVQHAVQGPGGLVEKSFTVFVKEKPAELLATFKWAPATVRVGDRVQFVDESLGSPDSWSWVFSGLQPLNEKSPATNFSKPGLVTVSLTVGKDKRTDTNKQTIDVLPPLPPSLKAAFSISTAKGTCPLDVQFKDLSQGAIASYRWDFGDGQTSDVKDPKHTYKKSGSWTPRLTIRNGDKQDARDTGEVVIAVSDPPPPPPWWKKPLVYSVIALAVWVLLIVPFVLRPVLAPQPKVAFRGPTVYFLRNLASRGIVNFVWPRSSVTIGTGKIGDIRLGGVGQKTVLLARVARAPLSSSYTMSVLQTGAAAKIIMKNDGLSGQQEVQEPLQSSRTMVLRQGDGFMFSGNTRMVWEQPSLKKQQKNK